VAAAIVLTSVPAVAQARVMAYAAGAQAAATPPKASALPATSVTAGSATINAQVNPGGSEVEECLFQYGSSASGEYGSTAACAQPPGSGRSPVLVAAQLSGLQPGTVYRFRVLARSAVGSVTSGSASFTTRSPPKASTLPPSAVWTTSATLNGTVNPRGTALEECVLQYGSVASGAYAASAPCEPTPGSGRSAVSVSAPVTGLLAGTSYQYRISARSAAGTAVSAQRTFATQSYPGLVALSASAVGDSTATLNATVNPNGLEVEECVFQYGAEGSAGYGSEVECSALPGNGSGPVGVSAPVTGLASATEYGYRITVRTVLGVSVSEPGSFRTLSAEPGELTGIHRIQHVVMIMQENRSFDNYFGTYPGANGIPAGVCVKDPLNGGCQAPFYDARDKDVGGPHGTAAAKADIDGGQMDGFVEQVESALHCTAGEPACVACREGGEEAACLDAMGYHDARQIPNYWTYAQSYVLQDNMFESAASWSEPEHRYLVSAWSATCPDGDTDPLRCVNSLGGHDPEIDPHTTYAWTDLTYLLHKYGVSWGYYIFEGTEPDCENDEAVTCSPVMQGPKTGGIWNPLADFTDVAEDDQRGNIQSLNDFYTAVHDQSACDLPAVSWIDPSGPVSEHPPALISAGQAYVTTLVNSIMRSPCWGSTAIFISWDDWGGFYDHVVPPDVDENGYGLRVPGLVISPYAKAGYIDHQQLSHDAYLKFVEDDFLSDARLNPKTDGRPDKRPDVREEAPGLGNLEEDFEFEQAPRPPLILPTDPAPGPASNPPGYVAPAEPPLAPAVSGGPGIAGRRAFLLTASVAEEQDLRMQNGRLRLTLGCNQSCLLDAQASVGPPEPANGAAQARAQAALSAGHSQTLELALSAAQLALAKDELRSGRTARARVTVTASGLDGARRSYVAEVRLGDG